MSNVTPPFGHPTPNTLSTVANKAAPLKSIGLPSFYWVTDSTSDSAFLGPIAGADGVYVVFAEEGDDDANTDFGIFLVSDCDTDNGAVSLFGTTPSPGSLSVVAGASATAEQVAFGVTNSGTPSGGYELKLTSGSGIAAGAKVRVVRIA